MAPVDVEAAIRAVLDPEIPVITLDDLGVIRSIEVEGDIVHVVMTPTYSGCPAMDAMRERVQHVIEAAGLTAAIEVTLQPAWTTDLISARGRTALRQFGIAPPGERGAVVVPLGRRIVACPVCGSEDTEVTSAFGATACKALRRCRSCKEPFEEFKTL
ncbi:phenylacetate-CoA oxygenase subunit PaaJ [Calidifontibacter sp. DB0510]|uniref:Phenylacetate-CoA oxygenase subunit PaaJ n=1 Tax=Metallococcus carri TaxID=1656884 RepID=A0A967B275_9MICO|nr:1,2-phenylacetyl-CoA epoxidase subunit PaaD [Metallococcus carri]NHN55930.1 phenylacetate-CoA oxygenase subunit PaaJ [Metallococcus carri]NOP38382.1 phenylacetate-CoA oxygenase subunit PaaJ [Calidifontibacter sp. DB2511S]